ncbi:MAG: EAL domain-containing protein [Rhodospirillales bacterium]|nr:MAG: EAL domain-containing protein [Rhodospirillales bacterium]
MDKRIHLILVAAYVAAGFVGMIASWLASGQFFIGMITGAVIVMLGALSHEFILRRDGFKRVLKGVVGLRDKVEQIERGIDGIQKDVGKATADARGANTAAQQVQQIQELAQKTAEEFEAFKSQGGSANGLAQTVEQLQAAAQQTASDIEIIQNAGNQLHSEFMAMQQQLAEQQQQFEQVQAMLQQMQGTMDALASRPAEPVPQPPQQTAAVHPDLVPERMPAQPPPEQAVMEQPVMEQPPMEQPAPPPAPEPPAAEPAPDEPTPLEQPVMAPPAALAATGSDLVNATLQEIDAHLSQAAGDGNADVTLRAVVEALKADAVDLYLEPIVTLPERKPAHYECHGGLRGADGTPLAVDPNLDPTGREELMRSIENALLARCLDRIAAVDAAGLDGGACFYNVAAETLADRGFFAGLIRHLQANPALAQRLVLECPQSALMEYGEQAVQDLVEVQETGCRFSIDGITDLEIDFESLVGFGFRFVKVGSKFMRVQANTADDPESVRGLARELKGIGIDVIVENVETDLSLVELIAFDIGYGQGSLFGQPALMQRTA